MKTPQEKYKNAQLNYDLNTGMFTFPQIHGIQKGEPNKMYFTIEVHHLNYLNTVEPTDNIIYCVHEGKVITTFSMLSLEQIKSDIEDIIDMYNNIRDCKSIESSMQNYLNQIKAHIAEEKKEAAKYSLSYPDTEQKGELSIND